MHRRSAKRKQLIRRILVYAMMSLSVVSLVTIMIFVIRGYQFDAASGKLEQTGLVQFASTPSGARIAINDRQISSRTPAKRTVVPGSHSFQITRNGYEAWSKTIDVEAGTIHWLNYVRLVPVMRQFERLFSYDRLDQSLASPDMRSILMFVDSSKPVLTHLDISDTKPSQSIIAITPESYSDSTTAEGHTFRMVRWDENGRYVLILHSFGDVREWLVLDTSRSQTYNLTREFATGFSEVYFSGTSGNVFYVLHENSIRKLDRSAGTISRSLVSRVDHFRLFEENTLSYVTLPSEATGLKSAGVYREGDTDPHIIEADVPGTARLDIAFARYLRQDYIATVVDGTLSIRKGDAWAHPDGSDALELIDSYMVDSTTSSVEFSPEYTYMIARGESVFYTYGVEHEVLTTSQLTDISSSSLLWLDEAHLWATDGGALTMRDFDGTNIVSINSVAEGHAASLSKNDTYLYSFQADENGTLYAGRVRMILQ